MSGRERSNKGLKSDQVIRVVFCWAEVGSYMAACWRALARRSGIDLHIVHPQKLFEKANPFHSVPGLLEGISNEMFQSDAPDLDRNLINLIASRRPDVIVVCGWFYRPYRRVVASPEFRTARILLGMDSPWRGTLSQRLAKVRLATFIRRIDMAVVSGERSGEYARRVGVPESKIHTGFYGFDHDLFSPVTRDKDKWPRQFIFVGRYVPQKDLSMLKKAYSMYRQSVTEPWGLTCYGEGVDGEILNGVPGVQNLGFAQPKDLPAIFSRHGAFLLSSRFEPWGVVLAEAIASGLPVVCTTVCGAGTDLVRPYYNGLLVSPGNAPAFARAMQWIHENESTLPEMGRRGKALAEAYSAEAWATRWHNYFLNALSEPAV